MRTYPFNAAQRRWLSKRLAVKSLLDRRFRWLGLLLVSLVALSLVIGIQAPATAQLPSFSGSDLGIALPRDVRRFGFVEVVPIRFENERLFEIASPTVRDRSNPGGLIPVEERAEEIEVNLRRVVAFDPNRVDPALEQPGKIPRIDYLTYFDPETFQVVISELNGATVLQATDAYRSRPQQLLTVTRWDADYHGVTIQELAEQWREIIAEELTDTLRSRTPSALLARLTDAFWVLLGIILVSLLFWGLQRLLRMRSKRLKALRTTELAAAGSESLKTETDEFTLQRLAFLTLLLDPLSIDKRLKINSLLRWLLRWGQGIVWIGGIFLMLVIFPLTRIWALRFGDLPFTFFLIWFLAGLADRLVDSFTDRTLKAWANNQINLFGLEAAERRSLRAASLSSAINGLSTVFFYGIALIWTLSRLGVPTNSVLAGGAILALAISFGTQNLVRDLVNGILILWEDQYAIGDVIIVNNVGGFVENMNLRITQLRNEEGRLITIPNSAITQVENLTRSWSRVDFTIEVAYETDVRKALEVLRTLSQQMYAEPEWRDRILEPPEVLGIDQIHHAGILIRVWIKTQPLQQWVVGREFRLRVRLAFEENDIKIGTPQQVLWYSQQAGHTNGDGTHSGAVPANFSMGDGD